MLVVVALTLSRLSEAICLIDIKKITFKVFIEGQFYVKLLCCLNQSFIALIQGGIETMVASAAKGTFDQCIIVKVNTSMETFAIDFIDAIEVGCSNFIWSLLDGSESIIHLVNVAVSDWCHVTT